MGVVAISEKSGAYRPPRAGACGRANLSPRWLAVAIVGAWLVLAVTAATARAQAPLPPIEVFPEAAATAPPAEAISDPRQPHAECGGWYVQSDYVGQPTGSTWWEYSCHSEWPVLGTGATNADWSGQYIVTTYFYWDGSQPVVYGAWVYDGYSDSLFTASYCDYWYSASGESFGPFGLSAPDQCSQ
jgi:hypothetical protein